MMTMRRNIAVLVLMLFPACMMPLGGPNRSPVSTETELTTRVPIDVVNSLRTGVLTVRSETLTASDIWINDGNTLEAKANSTSAAAFRTYVQNQSAERITDRVAESLLFQHAQSMLPTELQDRIDAYVNEEIANVVASQHDGIERRYEQLLEQQGRTIADVRNRRRRAVIISGYLEREIKPKIDEPTRAELLAAYESAKTAWTKPERRRMSLIDVRIQGHLDVDAKIDEPTRAQWDKARAAARATAERVGAAIESGEDFGSLARQHSGGLHAAEGGEWGWVDRGSLRERFQPAMDALYRLKAGDVSGVIESQDGFFLVRCDEIDPGMNARFEDVQPELKEQFMAGKFNRRISELVARLRSEAGIEPAMLERFHAAVVASVSERMMNGVTSAPGSSE